MRILLAMTRYAETGEGDVKALEGKFTGAHRLRIGDWRVRFRAHCQNPPPNRPRSHALENLTEAALNLCWPYSRSSIFIGG
jgi:hypothetical protein